MWTLRIGSTVTNWHGSKVRNYSSSLTAGAQIADLGVEDIMSHTTIQLLAHMRRRQRPQSLLSPGRIYAMSSQSYLMTTTPPNL